MKLNMKHNLELISAFEETSEGLAKILIELELESEVYPGLMKESIEYVEHVQKEFEKLKSRLYEI